MKFIWEIDDVMAPQDGNPLHPSRSGRLIRDGAGGLWVLGYMPDHKAAGPGHARVMTSLDDGMVVLLGSPQEAVDHLNSGTYTPAEFWRTRFARVGACMEADR